MSTPTPYTRVDLNPMPKSTLSPQVRDSGFGLSVIDIGKGHTVHIEARTSSQIFMKKNQNSSIINRKKIVNDKILKLTNAHLN